MIRMERFRAGPISWSHSMTLPITITITATTGRPDPPTGFEVPLPWQARGRSRTGLDKPNAAVGCWFVTFTAADVAEAPYSPRPISAGARHILRAMAGRRDLPERQR